MIYFDVDFNTLAEHIAKDKLKVYIYGAGMIGQIVVPYFINKYDLFNYVKCYIDADVSKHGKVISMNDMSTYDIKSVEQLQSIDEDSAIIITNSKFFPVTEYLDGISSLKNVKGYIVPVMQLREAESISPVQFKRKTTEMLIPKKIHYCWFGGTDIPPSLLDCIESWKKICPEYEIVQWNESNYDINRHQYTRQAYENRRYGFVSDVARLDILYENGGIYFDTDVCLLKKPDELLYQSGFLGVEKWGNINTGGGCGFVKGHPILKKLIDYRNNISFIRSDGSFNTSTNGLYETKVFMGNGMIPNNTLQYVDDVAVYPSSVFHPYDYMSCETVCNQSTISIHHFSGCWMSDQDKAERKKTQERYNNFIKNMNHA